MKGTLTGKLRVPGDKSITHRAILFSALTSGRCTVRGASPARDCANSAQCLQQLGFTVSQPAPDELLIDSPGLAKLRPPSQTLDAGNSGTTIRLLAGLLAGQPFQSILDGDDSLRTRPMARVLSRLEEMGARFAYLRKNDCAPFCVQGRELHAQTFTLNIASAQVQTALLLAGLQAEGRTTVQLPEPVRDHTVRMFRMLNLPGFISDADGKNVSVEKLANPLNPYDVLVPADLSSAAFFMVAAACLPGSDITLTDLALNPGRDLVIEVLSEMGAFVSVERRGSACGEELADVNVKAPDRLKGTRIGGDRIARGVDEIPVLALAGALCNGSFKVEGASELRVKESDRITAIVTNLKAAGAHIDECEDGFEIQGQRSLNGGCAWLTYDDHRMAMSGMVASLLTNTEVSVDNSDCIAVSYPDFLRDLDRLVNS